MALRIVVIGGVALGPKAACRAKRLNPEAEVILVDQSDRISYGGCGIPYYISGEGGKVSELQATPYGTIRNADFFRTHKGVVALTGTRATSIDRAAKTVTINTLATGAESTLPYDKLVLALGSMPFLPPIPGITLEGISPATNLDEAENIHKAVESGKINNAVVVGGGFIGLEMAVAFGDMWGIPVSVVELADQVMPGFLSPVLARMVAQDLKKNGAEVYTNEKVLEFKGENGHVTEVVTDKRTIKADLVVMAAGIRPNTAIAKEAGLAVTERGLVKVDEQMRTSDPDIYSGGDCVAIKHLVAGKDWWFPLGSMANRQGRVIGTNVTGGNATFPGAVGAFGIKLFTQSAAGAGLTASTAKANGFDPVTVHIEQLDKAHFYPERALMVLEMCVDKATRRVLGIQGMSSNGDALAARINAVTPLIAQGATSDDVSNLEVLYSPPFASAMDIVNVAGNVADNIISGRYITMSQEEFEALWAKRDSGEVFFLDSRVARDAAPMLEAHPGIWHNIPQDEIAKRFAEVPKDRPVAVVCNTGLRAYEALLDLRVAGFTNLSCLEGGIASAKKLGVME